MYNTDSRSHDEKFCVGGGLRTVGDFKGKFLSITSIVPTLEGAIDTFNPYTS